MLYALSGHFRIYLNGIYHEFAAGDFVLINSREVHQIDALSSEGGSYIVVRFLPELIYDGMTQSHFELKYLLPFITENSIYEKVISSSILNAKHSAIPGLMNEIIRESEEKQYGYELAIKNHIGGIFLWLLRYWHANGEEPLLETQELPFDPLPEQNQRQHHQSERNQRAEPGSAQMSHDRHLRSVSVPQVTLSNSLPNICMFLPNNTRNKCARDRKISLHNHATQDIIVCSVQWFLNGDWRCRTCHRLFCIRWYCNSKLYPIRKV